MHCISMWQQALGPGSWNITSSARRSWQSTGEFPESAPAPCKQLSRQKNSTNSIAEVRWLNILAAFFWVYGISTQSSVLHREHNTHQKASHNLCSTVKCATLNLFWRNKTPSIYINSLSFPNQYPWHWLFPQFIFYLSPTNEFSI